MTVLRGPPRRPTAGDPWAGARKSPGVHSECDESERTARLWERPALPRRRGCGPAGCVAQGECSGGHSRGERAGVQREPGPGRDRASVCPAQGFRKGPKAQPSCRPLATGKVAGPHSLGSGEATLPQEPELCQGSGCPEGVPHCTPAVHPGTRLSSSQSAVPWVAAGETEVGGLAQSTKCQTPPGGNHPSARPHCVTRGSRGAAGPKAQGAWAGPLWAALSWRASSPVLSPGESAWTSVAICLGLSPARGDLAAELCWGWGEAE